MKHTKKQKAAYLFDEIGNVSDAFLNEALAYRAKPQKTIHWKWPVSIAAGILAMVVAIPMLWNSVPWTNQEENTTGNAANPPASDAIPDVGDDSMDARPLTLEVILADRRADAFATLTPAEVDYFDAPYLLWQVEGDEALYRSRDLTNTELKRLISLIGQGTPVESNASSALTRVYLVVGNGDVLTPYLPATMGNVGAAVLFDYNAELIPSQSLISCISDILN